MSPSAFTPPPPNSVGSHSSNTRRSLNFMSLLLLVLFLIAGITLVQIALHQNKNAAEQSRFYASKAIADQQQLMSLTVSDYAFWGDAYRHMHATVSPEWAYVSKNMGPSLFETFGYEGLFVVDANDTTRYTVIKGELAESSAASWLGEPLGDLLAAARSKAADEEVLVQFMLVEGVPSLVGAAALTHDSDPEVSVVSGPESVLLFIDILEPAQIKQLGEEFGIADLHIGYQTPGEEISIPLPTPEATPLVLRWEIPEPGKQLLFLVLPLLAFACLLFALFSWFNRRQTLAAAAAIDISYQQAQGYQKQLSFLANHDALTGLPNRALLGDALDTACQIAKRQHRALAVLLIDLDNFKPINDNHSHALGDQLLVEVARRMAATVRPGDIVARVGGDEFVILMPELTEHDDAAVLAQRVINIIAMPYSINGLTLHVGASIGITRSDGNVSSPAELVHQADLAMYRAKQEGGNSYRWFGEELER